MHRTLASPPSTTPGVGDNPAIERLKLVLEARSTTRAIAARTKERKKQNRLAAVAERLAWERAYHDDTHARNQRWARQLTGSPYSAPQLLLCPAGDGPGGVDVDNWTTLSVPHGQKLPPSVKAIKPALKTDLPLMM
jgi:hypothetical protein